MQTHPRVNNKYPLSDQTNTQHWQRFEPMSDEFNNTTLNSSKWWDHNPRWYGRAPSRHLSRNVKVADGFLQLTMSKDTSLPVEYLYNNHAEYRDYVSASIVSKEAINYGYFEIGAKAKGKEYSYNMNLHSFKSDKEPKHYSLGSSWKAEKTLIDRFWTFGLEWTEKEIIYYVDGYPVRRVRNDRWHGPQYMIFDTETMIDWLSTPQDNDLPSTFQIDYVRSWKHVDTENDWSKRYELIKNDGNSSITNYVRSMDLNKPALKSK